VNECDDGKKGKKNNYEQPLRRRILNEVRKKTSSYRWIVLLKAFFYLFKLEKMWRNCRIIESETEAKNTVIKTTTKDLLKWWKSSTFFLFIFLWCVTLPLVILFVSMYINHQINLKHSLDEEKKSWLVTWERRVKDNKTTS
jgi:hypothetical protein